jgi:hypothetical protein
MVNAILFVSLGILGGIVTLNSGFFFGKTGERLTMRLRIETFKVIITMELYIIYLEHVKTGWLIF